MSRSVKPDDWDKVDWHKLESKRGHLRANKILYLIPENGLHLDVGTGRGDGTLLIAKKKKCIGLDFGKISTKIAKKKGLEVCQADARTMPYKANAFDSITCLDVLEHIPNPNQAIEEISRVLKSNGVFILQTPTQEMFKEKLLHFVRKYNIKKQKQPYDSSLGIKEIEEILGKNNFKILSKEVVGVWASNPLIRMISFSRVFHCKKNI
jgi:ubiquinone/menaquinone biosynthesis C-methylase UbiE